MSLIRAERTTASWLRMVLLVVCDFFPTFFFPLLATPATAGMPGSDSSVCVCERECVCGCVCECRLTKSTSVDGRATECVPIISSHTNTQQTHTGRNSRVHGAGHSCPTDQSVGTHTEGSRGWWEICESKCSKGGLGESTSHTLLHESAQCGLGSNS